MSTVETDQLLADIERLRRRSQGSTFIEFKKEAADNLYPLLSSIVEMLGERIGDVEDAITDIVDGGDLIGPELGAQLVAALKAGENLVQIVKTIPFTDELLARRVQDALDTYIEASTVANESLVAASIMDDYDEADLVDEDPDEESEDEAGDDDDEEEDDEDALDVTPITPDISPKDKR